MLEKYYSGQGYEVIRLPDGIKKGDSLMIGDTVFAYETTKENLLKAIALSFKETEGGAHINAIGTNHIEYAPGTREIQTVKKRS